MKIAVDFPSIVFREGPQRVLDLARGIEDLGYDEIAAFDHVVMGHPGEGRYTIYPANMPILEALMLLANVAAVTERVSLSTEVRVLPQRQPVLVAKQILTLDTLSGGRIEFSGEHYNSYDMGMEPVSPQGAGIPLWIGGDSPAALRRTAQKGGGWMASGVSDERALECMAEIRRRAEEDFGRDPASIGMQLMLAPPVRARWMP